MLLSALLLVGHLADGLGRAPFVESGVLIGGGTAAGVVFVENGAWRRACEEASGGVPIGYFRAQSDRVLAATANGMIATVDRGCSWAPVDGVLRNLEVTAIRSALDAPDVVYVTTGTAGQPNSVWKSVDGGVTFGETALAGVIHPLLDVVTSDDGASVYVTGADLDDEAPLVRGSLDGGASYFPVADADFVLAAYDRIRALAVDERVWLSLLSSSGAFIASADPALLDVTIEAELPGEVLALVPFAGARYALARPGALYRQTAMGEPFSIVPGVELLCLERGDDDAHLWGCGKPGSGVQFSVSTDGDTFEPALSTSEVLDRECPIGTPAASVCVAASADAGISDDDAGAADAGEIDEDAGPPDAGAPEEPVDGGVGAGPDRPGHLAGTDGDSACGAGTGAVWLALAVLAARRRSALDERRARS